MKIKQYILATLLPVGALLMSCAEQEPFSVAGPNDEPHILSPTFPDRLNGELPVVANINRDANFKMDLTVTPSAFVNIEWFIDGASVATGKSVDLHLLAGEYPMKVVATTEQGKSTYREGIVKVNPLDDDPWSDVVGVERFVYPGMQTVLLGKNLDKVKSIIVGGVEIKDIRVDQGQVGYTVPDNLADGKYRVVLVDVQGNQYGANLVTVSALSLITVGSDRISINSVCTMTGINLDQVASLNIGNAVVNEFVEKTFTTLKFRCPDLEPATYTITGKMTNGSAVKFYDINKQISEQNTIVVSEERTLWSGHHYVSWDLPDDDPHKTFNLIPMSEFAGLSSGSTLTVYYSVEPSDTYHQLRTTTGWWGDLPGTALIEFSENGSKEVILTQSALDKIQAEGGFLCVGHGYYVDLVTVR